MMSYSIITWSIELENLVIFNLVWCVLIFYGGFIILLTRLPVNRFLLGDNVGLRHLEGLDKAKPPS